jgi:hypothetical protein
MGSLVEYVFENCIRGTCICGKCEDTSAKKFQPDGNIVDVQFFKVALKNSKLTHTDKEVMKNNFIELIKNHKGIYREIDLFDGNEHNVIDIGRWIGNQGVALELMGMGELLGIWKVATPNRIAPDFSEETRNMLAEAGYISIQYKSTTPA